MNYSKPVLALAAVLATMLSLSSTPAYAINHVGDVFCNINNTQTVVRMRTFVDNYLLGTEDNNVYDDGFGIEKAIAFERQRCLRRGRDLCAASFIDQYGHPNYAFPGTPGSYRLSTVTVSGNLFTPAVVFNCNEGGNITLPPVRKILPNVSTTPLLAIPDPLP
jgi:hypothetical protein